MKYICIVIWFLLTKTLPFISNTWDVTIKGDEVIDIAIAPLFSGVSVMAIKGIKVGKGVCANGGPLGNNDPERLWNVSPSCFPLWKVVAKSTGPESPPLLTSSTV